MDYHNILLFLLDKPDFEAKATQYRNLDVIEISFYAGEKEVTILHYFTSEFSKLPTFYLYKCSFFGQLAHVIPTENELSWICINDLDSVSVNFECPELAFYDSVCRHIKLLTQLICVPDFNKEELLREFQVNWLNQTKSISRNTTQHLYCSLPSKKVTKLKLFNPESKFKTFFQSTHVALPYDNKDASLECFFDCNGRKEIKDNLCISIPLGSVSPFMDNNEEGIKKWIHDSLKTVSKNDKTELEDIFYDWAKIEFWLILHFDTPSGRTWIGAKLMHLNKTEKKKFPEKLEHFKNWEVESFSVDNVNLESTLSRSGAKITLHNKKILLIGCGSVGCEIAHKIASSGIGHLTLIDPDLYLISNIYRHRLEKCYLNKNKAQALSHQLINQFPWISIDAQVNSKLLDLRSNETLDEYDLIIIAIGAPTHERLFHDYIVKSSVKVPVIYSWLEGYGIGGHAVLDIPNKPGCLRCAYVETNTGVRGLASNLNFIEANQNVAKNYAGCGEMFIPYGAISSTQTALLAADLAVGYLEGKLKESKKVSWKGDCTDAKSEGLKLTPRYQNFSLSLQKLPLKHPLCDVCQTKEFITYQSKCGKRLYLPQSLHQQLCAYRQQEPASLESAGLLIGYCNQSGEALIDSLTTPKISDQRTRTTFKLDAAAHQTEIEKAYIESERLLGYVGTWHTHPEEVPRPSWPDKTDWRTHEKENPDRPLFFIVVGIKQMAVYTLENGEIIELTMMQ